MAKPKKAELVALISRLKAENIALNERLDQCQAELAVARGRSSDLEERLELISVLAPPPKAGTRGARGAVGTTVLAPTNGHQGAERTGGPASAAPRSGPAARAEAVLA